MYQLIYNFYKKNNYFKELNKITFRKKIKVGLIDKDFHIENSHGFYSLKLIEILQTFYNFDIIYIDLEKEKTFSKSIKLLLDQKVNIIVNTVTSSVIEKNCNIPDNIIFISALDNVSPQEYCFPNILENVFVVQDENQELFNNTFKTLGFLNEFYNGNSTATILSLMYFIIIY